MNFVELYDTARPYIAAFVILRRDNKIAMVLRKNTGYMDGFYGLPSGKVEYGETYAQGAIREAKEEAGVSIDESALRFAHAVHRHGEERGGFMDWVDMYFEVQQWEGEPHNAETEKSESLDWIEITEQTQNVVPHQLDALRKIMKGAPYSSYGWSKNN